MLSIDYGNTNIINVPQSYVTLVSGTFYTMDTDQFRKDLRELEASEEGIVFPATHTHATEVTVAGTTLARSVIIIAPYTVEFENGAWTVQLEGSNNNIWSVGDGILVQNMVQVIPTNSAGLITVVSGSGVTEQDKDDIADKVWESSKDDHNNPDTFGRSVQVTEKLTKTLL